MVQKFNSSTGQRQTGERRLVKDTGGPVIAHSSFISISLEKSIGEMGNLLAHYQLL